MLSGAADGNIGNGHEILVGICDYESERGIIVS
jgi:hypothetical protein